jgi:hypothetical protein
MTQCYFETILAVDKTPRRICPSTRTKTMTCAYGLKVRMLRE